MITEFKNSYLSGDLHIQMDLFTETLEKDIKETEERLEKAKETEKENQVPNTPAEIIAHTELLLQGKPVFLSASLPYFHLSVSFFFFFLHFCFSSLLPSFLLFFSFSVPFCFSYLLPSSCYFFLFLSFLLLFLTSFFSAFSFLVFLLPWFVLTHLFRNFILQQLFLYN